jgi:hypothetical protein
MIKEQAAKLIAKHSANFGTVMPFEDAELFNALMSTANYTINMVEFLKRTDKFIAAPKEVVHSATFKDEDSAKTFEELLCAYGFWIMVSGTSRDWRNPAYVDWYHLVDGINLDDMAFYSLWMALVVEQLNGDYGKWEVTFSADSVDDYRCLQHGRCVTDIKWHRYSKTYDKYPAIAWYLYKPVRGYTYAADEAQDEFFSIMNGNEVAKLMSKLRSCDGLIPTTYLKHFHDEQLDVVKEILSNRYYRDVDHELLTDVALAQFRMGRKQIALELALHGVLNGEDYEMFIESAEKQDAEMGTNFARDFSRVKAYRDLQIQIGENSTVSSKAKLKV